MFLTIKLMISQHNNHAALQEIGNRVARLWESLHKRSVRKLAYCSYSLS